LVLDKLIIKRLDNQTLEIPYQTIKQFKEYWFHKEYINAIISDKETLNYFLSILSSFGKGGGWKPEDLKTEEKLNAKNLAKWISWPISARTKENFKSINELKFDKTKFQKFLNISKEWNILENQLKIVIDEMLNLGKDPNDIIKDKWFDAPAIDAWELENICKKVIEENPDIVQQYKWWKTTTLWFFVWQVMKKSWGKANPKIIWDLVMKLLE
jgi:aspartyl-tRNA(Asn)/glutamyl-tRNA(Gln) amidotransferase subunit B